MQPTSIIIVDEDINACQTLRSILSDESFDIHTFSNGNEALNILDTNHSQIVITEIKLPDFSGIEFLQKIKAISSSIPVLILTSHGTIDIAVTAIRHGASDFLSKPIVKELILLSIKKMLKDQVDSTKKSRVADSNFNRLEKKELKTVNPEIIQILKRAKKIAKSNASVLIQGESGTGKELLAAYIVRYSGREKYPYVTMNCAALPDTLAESELFGHEKGAFTGAFQKRIGKFEQAHGGTLLLDEISELSLPLQAKLLRVLQEKMVDRLGGRKSIAIDTRVISTCNVNLNQAVKDGSFRNDLFYRINVIPFIIPPLRQRKEDIPILTEYFIQRHSVLNNKQICGVSDEALKCLCSHQWFGNVRELENVIERAVLISDQSTILPEHLFMDEDNVEDRELKFSVGTTVREMERKLIFNTLEHVNENRTHAAQLLGISIRTLRNKLREYRTEYQDVDESVAE
ncbi:MAG: sigma-54 dependent transcriptional regulator [Desulfobacteraceae bacterium]|jgi:DNA-binding NtrC family response regulator